MSLNVKDKVHNVCTVWSSGQPELQSVTQQTPLRRPSAGPGPKIKFIKPSAILPNSNIANIVGTFLKINVLLESFDFFKCR